MIIKKYKNGKTYNTNTYKDQVKKTTSVQKTNPDRQVRKVDVAYTKTQRTTSPWKSGKKKGCGCGKKG